MNEYQMFSNDKLTIALELNTEVCKEEKEQLLANGFIIIGDKIKAEDTKEAIEKFKSQFCEDLKEFSDTNLITSVVDGLSQL